MEVLGRSFLWIPLPNGGGPHSGPLDLPTLEIEGQAYVPVFSSEEQFRQVAGAQMAYTIAPAVEFARGLPPQVGVIVNPEGVVGVPLPPPAVAELCRAGRTPLDGPASGGRVRLFEPDWQDDPVDFLAAASAEFAATGVVRTARRCMAAIETADPVMFVGVELAHWEGDARALPPRRPGPGPRQGPSQDPGQPRPPGGGPGPGLRLDADERPPVLRPRPVTPAGAVPGGGGRTAPPSTQASPARRSLKLGSRQGNFSKGRYT